MEHRNPGQSHGNPPPRRGSLLLKAVVAGLLLLAVGAGLLMSGVFDGDAEQLTDDEITRLKAEAKSQRGGVDERVLQCSAVGAPMALQDRGKAAAAAKRAAQRDEKLRRAIVGEWELPEDGVYRLALRDDNSGRLVYKPSGLNKVALLTSKLEIEITWELKDGHVDMNSVAGKPAFAFKTAIRSRGKRKFYRIDELNGETMVLYELKKKKLDRWTRVQ